MPPGAQPARVLVVEDHPIVREGLAQLLQEQEDLVICGGVGRRSEALRAVERLKPDVVVVDISLGDGSGLELIKDIRARFADLPVLVLSMHDESLYAERALRAGAQGYVMKDEATETVVAAIRRVLEGGIWLSERMSGRMLRNLVSGGGEPTTPIERLTDRELEVFELIGRGLDVGEIAARLHLSPKTIEYYRSRIKDKLQVRHTKELLRRAVLWVEGVRSG